MNKDLDLLRDAAQEAGRLALKLQEGGLQIWRKEGGSPVTSADLAVDDLLKERLRAARPDYGWLSEETADDPERLARDRVFMVDPIDGTRAYISGRPWWVVSVAVAEAGRPTAGVIYNAALEETYEAAEGGGAFLNGAPIHCSTVTDLETCAMLADPALFADGWEEPWPSMRVERRNAIAYRMALVAAGTFDAAIAMGDKNDWDIAAGLVIAAEAGAVSTDHKGRNLPLNSPTAKNASLICTAPALHPLILARTAPIDLDETSS
jgi:myo-inositol-1(or 4)-monophosphatase